LKRFRGQKERTAKLTTKHSVKGAQQSSETKIFQSANQSVPSNRSLVGKHMEEALMPRNRCKEKKGWEEGGGLHMAV